MQFKCKFGSFYARHEKYLCKGQSPGCVDLIRTSDQKRWVDNGRFSLYDGGEGYFNVSLAKFTLQDTGKYQCAVNLPVAIDTYDEINLVVTDGKSSVHDYNTFPSFCFGFFLNANLLL